MDFTEDDLDAAARELDALIEDLRKVEGMDVPRSLREALDSPIDLLVTVSQISLVMRYPEEDRKADRQRVVRLDRALEIISEMERELVETRVESGIRRMRKTLAPISSAVASTLRALIRIASDEGIRALLRKFWGELLRNLADVAAASGIIAALVGASGSRDKWADKVRAAALPQRTSAPRVRRRKRTRT